MPMVVNDPGPYAARRPLCLASPGQAAAQGAENGVRLAGRTLRRRAEKDGRRVAYPVLCRPAAKVRAAVGEVGLLGVGVVVAVVLLRGLGLQQPVHRRCRGSGDSKLNKEYKDERK